jgi:hypothetical protein
MEMRYDPEENEDATHSAIEPTEAILSASDQPEQSLDFQMDQRPEY